MDFIPDWDDDERMGFLFSFFPPSRNADRSHWDAKLAFWTEAIEAWSDRTGNLVVSRRKLEQTFRRKRSTPACLATVLDEMKKSGKLGEKSSFLRRRGWLSWGYDYVAQTVRWVTKRASGGGKDKFSADAEQQLVVRSRIKAVAVDLARHVRESALYRESARGMISLDDLKRFAEESSCSRFFSTDQEHSDNLALVILEMTEANILVVHEELSVVKLSEEAIGKGSPAITETDVAVYRLWLTERKLQADVGQLTQKMTWLKSRAKGLLSEKRRGEALGLLRRSKQLERMLSQCEAHQTTIQLQLDKFEGIATNKMIVDTFSASSAALKKELSGLSVKKIEDVLEGVEEALAECNEINEAFTAANERIADDSFDIDELEAELARLTVSGPKQEESEEAALFTPAAAAAPKKAVQETVQEDEEVSTEKKETAKRSTERTRAELA